MTSELPPITEIKPGIWEIPKSYKQGMNVPARIFATKKLLEQMDSGVFEQVTNVACLPGIVKSAMCMPDGHWGYGFPIGGVAAFDLDDGVISPGGIGFDINCLVKDTEILTEQGYVIPIQDFEQYFIDTNIKHDSYELKMKKGQSKVNLISLDTGKKEFCVNTPIMFMKKKHLGKILRIETKLGYKIEVTDDHPILTKQGMIKADELKKEKECDIAVCPFRGIPYQAPPDLLLAEEAMFSKQESNELKKRELLPLSLDNPKLPIIARLFGYLIGDGSIYFSSEKGFVNAYGQKEDLEQIKCDFEKIGFSGRIYTRSRMHNIPTKYGNVRFTSSNCELHVSSRSLAKLFYALGYPKGIKTSVDFLVPEWIMKSPLWLKRLFLSGLFGAELSKPRTHTKTGFDCPTLSMNKNSKLLNNARKYCAQLVLLLDEFDIKAHNLLVRKDFKNRQGPTHRLKLQISSEEENLIRLYSLIGYIYNSKRQNLASAAILYIKEKKLLTNIRKHASEKIKELRKLGFKVREIQDLLAAENIDRRFIYRHFYESAEQKITLDFISFKDYAEIKIKDIQEYGCLFDKVISISEHDYNGEVYDFNVPDTHNFVANSIIVSNCGMRLLKTNLTYEQVKPKLRELVDTLFKSVPTGVGVKGFLDISKQQFKDVVTEGVPWCVKHGYGWEEDIERIEEHGTIKGADASKISDRAIARGLGQLGTLGSGNHYLEVQLIGAHSIHDKEAAKKFGIEKEGQIVVMVHCGSRGFGHQVATDYLKIFDEGMRKYSIHVKDRQLACAPFSSKEGQDYYAAMACAANMAFANRQVIIHQVRKCFEKVFKKTAEGMEMSLIYDVAHNIAKVEEHTVDGKKKKVLVHRKGSTRAFPPHHPELAPIFRDTGQPVIIGGSMETGSYLLLGTEKAMDETFGSTAHGSGRTMSRTQAKKEVRGDKLQRDMEQKGIYVKAASMSGLAEEAGSAYKNINEVVDALELTGISKKVVALKPIGNIKG